MIRFFLAFAASIVFFGNAVTAFAGSMIDISDSGETNVTVGATGPVELTQFNVRKTTMYVGNAIGETFHVISGGTYSDLSFSLGLQQTSGSATTYSAYIQAWNATSFTTSGSPLGSSGPYYMSGIVDAHGNPVTGPATFDTITFDMGGPITLSGDSDYVIYLMATNGSSNGNAGALLKTLTGKSGSDPFMGGQYVDFDPAMNRWYSYGHGNDAPHVDLAFDIALSSPAPPEPSTAILLALGSVGMGAFGWRRRRMSVSPAPSIG